MSKRASKKVAMLVFANAPPVPLGGKISFALLMLALAGVLVRKVPLNGQSIGVALATVIAVVVVLEALLPGSYGGGFHDRGVLAGVAGGLCAILFRSARQGDCHRPFSRTWHLSALAFISGPLVGLVLALLTVLLSEVSPLDRGYTFGVFISIGTLGGLIGAGVVAAVSLSGSLHSSESDKQD